MGPECYLLIVLIVVLLLLTYRVCILHFRLFPLLCLLSLGPRTANARGKSNNRHYYSIWSNVLNSF